MELIGPDAREKRMAFFKLVFGQTRGLVCLAFLSSGGRKKFTEEFYEYPQQLNEMLDAIERGLENHNVYFCPQLLRERRRQKESIGATPNAWADLDYCDPDNLLVEPTVVLESSPNRWQAFWALDEEYDPDDVEDLSRRIAYAHADQGADRSGWDLTQLLRVPYTYNYKYKDAIVKIQSANRSRYRLEDFEDYPDSGNYAKVSIPMPNEEDLPKIVAEELLQEKRLQVNPMIWRLFSEEPESDWSKSLWNLEMLLFEAGYSREQVFVIARQARCNKYARDGRSQTLLWKETCRAEAKAELHKELFKPVSEEQEPLLSDEERNLLKTLPPTLVEKYQEWASSLGDAAPQYHQAGGFVVLSALLSGSIRLPTSYGTVIPNLWFLILADTTLTRKTTAMDIAIDLVMEIDDDAVMATDGSLEGLLTTLATRPGRPSIFLRDEFSGLLEAMTRKDYMAGMPELLTKLYDGKMQKRVLRKEVIEVRDPRLILFAGGIKDKVTSLLTHEYVSSGFMPRFIFITAESDITRLRPIGPPSQKTTGGKDALLAELKDLYSHYNRTVMMSSDKLRSKIEMPVMYEAELTDDAWVRYNQLEVQLLDAGVKSDRPDLMTPVGDRLAKSVLKAATLLAATRQRGDNVIVELEDLLRAIRYGEQWRQYGVEIISAVGKNSVERQLDTIYNAIRKKMPNGVSRSYLMQSYHLTARDATQIFETLEQRGLVTRQRAGRTELLLARE